MRRRSSLSPAGFFEALARRRAELGMSYASLSARSGVSMPTVVRILSGRHAAPSFNNVAAIAEALGLTIQLSASVNSAQMRSGQAKGKAAAIVGMLQGTSGLEGQGLDSRSLQRLRRQTEVELLAGSKRNLW